MPSTRRLYDLRHSLERIAFAVTATACGGGHASGPSARDGAPTGAAESGAPIHVGAGITAYRRNTLALLSPADGGAPVSCAAHVVGFYNLEVIDELPEGGFSVRTLATAPAVDAGSPRIPLGIALADVDGDGQVDVFVSDPLGNWLAKGKGDGTFLGVAPPTALASFPATPEPAFKTVGAGRVLLGMENASFVATAQGGPDAPWLAPLTSNKDIINLTSPVCVALAFDAGAQATLLCPAPLWKYGQQFLSYDLSQITAGILPEPAGIAPTFAPPYIVPFDSFDHLERLPLSGCEGSLVGVGVFANGAAGAHRRIERLTLAGSSFAISELDTPFEVTTFDIVPGANADAIVGAVGTGSTGSIFASYRVTGCNDWSDLGSVPIDFDWRPAPAPGFGDATDRAAAVVPKTDGVQILGWRVSAPASNGYRFVHYDGYEIRSWTVSLTHGPTWTGSFDVAQFSLHADRNDLIAP